MRYYRQSGSTHKIGHWSRDHGLSVLNDSLVEANETEMVTLTVVTREEKPYVMIREGKTGNDAFDGFAIDLLKVREEGK